jgi:glycerol-3-phosphate acyltransferase PlsY
MRVLISTLILLFDLSRAPRLSAILTVLCVAIMLFFPIVGSILLAIHVVLCVLSALVFWKKHDKRIREIPLTVFAISSLIRWQQKLLGDPHA